MNSRANEDPLDEQNLQDVDLRELFETTAPSSRPVDVEKLLADAAFRRLSSSRPWKLLAAALLLVAAGVGFGWYSTWSHTKEEVTRLQTSVDTELVELRRDVAAVLDVLRQGQEGILEAQQDGIKQVANFLRTDYRMLIGRLEAEVEELAMAVDPSRFPAMPESPMRHKEER